MLTAYLKGVGHGWQKSDQTTSNGSPGKDGLLALGVVEKGLQCFLFHKANTLLANGQSSSHSVSTVFQVLTPRLGCHCQCLGMEALALSQIVSLMLLHSKTMAVQQKNLTNTFTQKQLPTQEQITVTGDLSECCLWPEAGEFHILSHRLRYIVACVSYVHQAKVCIARLLCMNTCTNPVSSVKHIIYKSIARHHGGIHRVYDSDNCWHT